MVLAVLVRFCRRKIIKIFLSALSFENELFLTFKKILIKILTHSDGAKNRLIFIFGDYAF